MLHCQMLNNFLAAAVVFAVAAGYSTECRGENPVDVAARCIQRMDQIVLRVQNAAEEDVSRCVQEIRRLKADGQQEAATQVARECVSRSRERTRLANSELREICERCINYLLDFGLEQLAGRVRYHCGISIDAVERIHIRLENIIRDALLG